MLVRVVIFFIGLFICSYKGIKLLLGLHKPEKTRDFYGLNDYRLQLDWRRIGNDEPLSHTITNIVVEWNRLDPQRGAKVLLAFAGITNLVWLIAITIL